MAIHAGKNPKYMKFHGQCQALWPGCPARDQLDATNGCIIGAARVVAVRKYTDAIGRSNPWAALPEKPAYVWQIEDVVPLQTPIPCSGQLRVWWLEESATAVVLQTISAYYAAKVSAMGPLRNPPVMIAPAPSSTGPCSSSFSSFPSSSASAFHSAALSQFTNSRLSAPKKSPEPRAAPKARNTSLASSAAADGASRVEAGGNEAGSRRGGRGRGGVEVGSGGEAEQLDMAQVLASLSTLQRGGRVERHYHTSASSASSDFNTFGHNQSSAEASTRGRERWAQLSAATNADPESSPGADSGGSAGSGSGSDGGSRSSSGSPQESSAFERDAFDSSRKGLAQGQGYSGRKRGAELQSSRSDEGDSPNSNSNGGSRSSGGGSGDGDGSGAERPSKRSRLDERSTNSSRSNGNGGSGNGGSTGSSSGDDSTPLSTYRRLEQQFRPVAQ